MTLSGFIDIIVLGAIIIIAIGCFISAFGEDSFKGCGCLILFLIASAIVGFTVVFLYHWISYRFFNG